jgi:hypothetical protein
MAEAFRAEAPVGGTVDSVNVFVAKKTKAKRLVAGLYADAGGSPGVLLATGPDGSALEPGRRRDVPRRAGVRVRDREGGRLAIAW